MALLVGAVGCSNNPPQQRNKPPSDVRGDSTINPLLLKLCRDHGLEATIDGGWVLVPDRPRICGAVVRNTQPRPQVKSIQIDVYLEVAQGRILVESFGGFGTTMDEAVADGIHNFMANSFHVILAAFFAAKDDQAQIEHWVVDGKPRRVTIGNMGIRGNPPNPDKPPIDWFKDLETEIKRSALPSGTHWVRCYYAQMQNQATAVEVLLDNDDWAPVQSAIASLDWPKAEDFYSVRVFLIIQDGEG